MLMWLLVIVTVLGLLYGFFLAFADKKFKVEGNELISEVENVLPQAQCGACGFAGCHSYAEAVVLRPEVLPNLCVPGKKCVADKVASLTGKQAADMEPKIAFVACSGGRENTKDIFIYDGIHDCTAASMLQGGPKACHFGCLGFGTCVKACPFGAITMNDSGLPQIDDKLCTGCGVCQKACPRGVIRLIRPGLQAAVGCVSHEKGPLKRKICSGACIGCGICMRTCPHGAIIISGNLAVVNSDICLTLCGRPVCVEKCPTKALALVIDMPAVDDCKLLKTGEQ